MPYTEEYNEKMPESFLADYHNDMREISIQNGVRYWDYSEDDEFAEHAELFSDSDYLNIDGAVKFTNMLIERLYAEKLLAVEE